MEKLDRGAQAELLRAVAEARDRQAFARLFDYFAPRIKGYLMRLGADDGMAEELVQESLLLVWRKAHTFDPEKSSVATWLFTIARNRRIDSLRRLRYPFPDPEDPSLHPEAERRQDEAYEMVQSAEHLRRAVAQLPAEQAELIALAFFDGRTHRDIASDRNLPLGTVKSRIRLALNRLRKEMAAFHDGYHDEKSNG